MELTTGQLSKLSEGSNSTIYRFQDSDSKDSLALKVVSTAHRKEAEHLLNEYRFLAQIDHQNIIYPFLFRTGIAFQGQHNHVLVTKYAPHGSLLHFVKKHKLTLQNCRHIFKEICQGVQHLHSNNIAHRDLKLENILVFEEENQYQFKIADFGFADDTEVDGKEKLVRGVKGTKRGYMAPEIHTSLEKSEGYSAKRADVFALGVMLFALIFRKLPFEFATNQNPLFKHLEGNNFPTFWDCHTKQFDRKSLESEESMEELKKLLEGMICRDPAQRYSLQEIIGHNWLMAKATPPSF